MVFPISATILVKNAQDTIGECLESLREFDEIILLDNGSSDDTLKIAREFDALYGNLRIYSSEFIGFGALKNLAISYAKNDWIFSIDSDEVLESRTLELLKNLFGSESGSNDSESSDTSKQSTLHTGKLPAPNTIYALPRKNLYNGEWIKACGWYPDFVTRVFCKNYTRFNDNIVHESIVIPKDAKVLKLDSGLKHYAFNGISHLLEKMQRYSTLWAQQNANKASSPLKAIIHGSWTFFRNYIFKKGFLYGYKGFVISVCNGLGAFFKYMKLYENTIQKPKSVSLIITTYNQKERLALVLDSVRNLSVLPTEVLIADDGSKEDTRELIESYAHTFPCPLRHIWHEDSGFRLSTIRNKAIKEAQGDYIIIIDGDMILEPHFVADHLAYAKPKVFLQGSRVITNSHTSESMLQAYQEGAKSAYKRVFGLGGFKARRCKILSRFVYRTSRIDSEFFTKKDFIKGIRGCNMSFFKSDCEAINGFNESFVGWGREDSEFVARFLFNGGQLRRLKFAGVAYHIYHDENPRDMLGVNHNIYLETIREKKIQW
ncbi:glycosyl transferase family 2 [Helicobacter pullorum]|uniref:glycosyltransferase family 2 protein n=1 Tax=Helicobacter pullorum TaxID=35818 RepID=UPI0008168F4F|nr:glycosyltransferase [Helicobacter pullorum]OCR16556.1 glycosyl transferase family 2 [Helicobacter pullorum]